MRANEYRQNTVANNLANVDTTGFKHDILVFAQRPVQSRVSPGQMRLTEPVLDGMSGGITGGPTYHAFEQGSLDATGRDLDVAIDGDGFLPVLDGDQVRFTRDGRMTFNAAGELVLAAGEGRLRVLDEAGLPIRRHEGGDKVMITEGGAVQQGPNVVLGHIGLTSFDDLNHLRKVGKNLFTADGATPIPAHGQFVPQTLEHSTFDPVQGLMSMIEVQRAYQLNATVLTLQDQATGQAVNLVGRVA